MGQGIPLSEQIFALCEFQGWRKAERLGKPVLSKNNSNFLNRCGHPDIKTSKNLILPKRPFPRHIIDAGSKAWAKQRILKTAREKHQLTYKGMPIRLTEYFSTATLQSKSWKKKKIRQQRTLYPAKLSFRNEGKR